MNQAFESHFEVLALDDSLEDMELYKRKLFSIPGVTFNIDQAQSVQQAKDKTDKNNHFDCYIIDYNLPDATGLDFVRHLVSEKKIKNEKAAIIVVTGHGNEEIAAEAFRLGAHEYLTKKSISDGFFCRPVLNAIEKAQLTAQLHHFQNRLKQSNKDLSLFAHTAAHDLKSPLRRISSYCEILQDDAAKRLNQEETGILNRMMVNAKRMQRLVDSLLTYSLIEYDDEEKEELDLNKIVADVINEHEEQINESNASIDVGQLPKVLIYPVRMRQLLSNLLSNALKYKSKNPPHIVIQAQQESNFTTISVQDNGEGISGAQQEEIFKDFRRLHNNEDIEGTGLGLSICKKIVERHGGKIWVESELDKGSTFYFTIQTS